MTTEPTPHPAPAPRESEALLQQALLRIRAARETLKGDPTKLTPTPHRKN